MFLSVFRSIESLSPAFKSAVLVNVIVMGGFPFPNLLAAVESLAFNVERTRTHHFFMFNGIRRCSGPNEKRF